ncbi:TIGR02679 family protein [Microbacterium hominis]|uniref:TIGR02679 family protein n=1 Tax=Microbacterium hominis TaxID=162426 RepID=A0A7D4PLL4_9MICO|nr:TIGR02679 family protein [Microbacterium hominis]QKJ18950.1 TIGR02679 family protein [Microbacterium hominis]
MWDAIGARLERTRLSVGGSLHIQIDSAGAAHLSGLLGRPLEAGAVTLKLAELDQRLRALDGGAGLVATVELVRETPLVDRKKIRQDRADAVFEIYRQLEDAVGVGGLSPAQAHAFVGSVRSSGILTRAGAGAGGAIARFAVGWAELVSSDAFVLDEQRTWLLGEFAFRFTGSAHGFDEGSRASKLMLRAVAARFDEPTPKSGEDRRRLWNLAGILTDSVSGTALTWGLRPPGEDPWSVMLYERARQGLVTHLTLQELDLAGDAALAAPGTTVFACENPQVLQAAADARAPATLVCLSGQASAAGWRVIRHLLAAGVTVKYHGDFDWPGIAIAARLHGAGAQMWRMGAADYANALASLNETEPLDGPACLTPWDAALADTMAARGIVVHEEALIGVLLEDLLATEPAPL